MPSRSSFTDRPDTIFGGQSDPLSNPFARAAAAIQPPASASNPMAAASQPQSKGYSALFDPSAGGARGIIGALMGNPTRQEYQQTQIGSKRSAAFSKLGDAIQAGVPPQKAFLQFVNSPEGMDFWTTSTEPMAEIAQFMKQSGASKGDPYTLSGNDVRYDENNNPVARGPGQGETEATRSFNSLSSIAGFTPEQKAEAAKAKIMGGNGDATQREAAMRSLVDKGLMDQDTANKWLAGVVSIVPVKDANGNVTGQQVYDASTGKAIMLGQPNAANTPQPPTGVDEPANDPKQGSKLRRLTELGGTAADVVDGAGPSALIGEKVGGLFGNVPGMGGLSGSVDAVKRQGLNQIAADAGTLNDLYSKNNRASAGDVKNVKAIIDGITGFSTNPTQAAEKLIAFNDYLDTREKLSNVDYNNVNKPQQSRQDALAELDAIQRARSNLPSRDELLAKIEALKSQPSELEKRIPDVEQGLGQGVKDLKTVTGVGADAVKPDASGQPYTFKNEADLRTELKKGTVKAGDTVIINGVPRTLAVRPK